MAARVLANVIVVGGTVLAKAVVQAYRQALANAKSSGVAHETIQNTIGKANKAITKQEAWQILGVSAETPWEDIIKKYERMFENNAKNGSFYLQSKVYRAMECLESIKKSKGDGDPS